MKTLDVASFISQPSSALCWCDMMANKTHKFDRSFVMTYAEYFHAMTSRTVSIIRDFETAFGKEEVERVLTEWSERVGQELAPKNISDFAGFKEYWKSTLESENWSNILTCSFTEESEKKLACRYSECLWAKTLKDLDAEDIGYILFCHPDFAMAKAIHPNLRLERSRTIMQDHGFCNHTFFWDGE